MYEGSIIKIRNILSVRSLVNSSLKSHHGFNNPKRCDVPLHPTTSDAHIPPPSPYLAGKRGGSIRHITAYAIDISGEDIRRETKIEERRDRNSPCSGEGKKE